MRQQPSCTACSIVGSTFFKVLQLQAAHVLPMPQQPGCQRVKSCRLCGGAQLRQVQRSVAAQLGGVRTVVPPLAHQRGSMPANNMAREYSQ